MRVTFWVARSGKLRAEFAGGEVVEGAEAAGELSVGQAALAVELAEMIRGRPFAFQRVAFQRERWARGGLTPSTGGAAHVLGIQDGGRPRGRPKNKNAPAGVGARFLTVISILCGNGFVKAKRQIFTRITKWRIFNLLRVSWKSNGGPLLIIINPPYTKKAQKTSDGPPSRMAFPVGEGLRTTEPLLATGKPGRTEGHPRQLPFWYCFEP